MAFLTRTTTRAYRGVVASEAEMLALNATISDWVTRSDLSGQIFELTALPPSALANWESYPVGSGGSGGDVSTDAIWDANGDLVVGTGANTATRLPMGVANQILGVNSGGTGLQWQTPASAGSVVTDTIWNAAGDLAVGTGSDTASRLAIGTAGQMLRVNSGATGLEWSSRVLNRLDWADYVNVASAATTDIGAANSNRVVITGTATISSLGTGSAGMQIEVFFSSGGGTLTNNFTSLILPSGANIVWRQFDNATFSWISSGNWRCIAYERYDGTALVGGSGLPSQAEAEAGTENTKSMTPLRTKQAIDFQRAISDQTTAEAGVDNTVIMTPLRTAQAIAVLGGGGGGGDIASDTLWAAAGDIVVATGNDAAARLAIGTVGQKLTVTGANTVAWAGATAVAPEDVSTTTYTFIEADNGKIKRFTNASGCSATINSGLSSGWTCTVVRGVGAGNLTLVQGTATLTSIDGELVIYNEKGIASIIQIATDSYIAAGGIGYPYLPYTNFSANLSLTLAHVGGVLHPSADTNNRTVTIPANASIAFKVGTTIPIVNLANTVTVAITTDTLLWAGTASSGSRTLSAPGKCVIEKVATTTWLISGAGLA